MQVAAKQMVGLYLSVWVRGDLAPCIRGVQATSVGTGVMGYLGNKGVPSAPGPVCMPFCTTPAHPTPNVSTWCSLGMKP